LEDSVFVGSHEIIEDLDVFLDDVLVEKSRFLQEMGV
jgi:hypothetical protein